MPPTLLFFLIVAAILVAVPLALAGFIAALFVGMELWSAHEARKQIEEHAKRERLPMR